MPNCHFLFCFVLFWKERFGGSREGVEPWHYSQIVFWSWKTWWLATNIRAGCCSVPSSVDEVCLLQDNVKQWCSWRNSRWMGAGPMAVSCPSPCFFLSEPNNRNVYVCTVSAFPPHFYDTVFHCLFFFCLFRFVFLTSFPYDLSLNLACVVNSDTGADRT